MRVPVRATGPRARRVAPSAGRDASTAVELYGSLFFDARGATCHASDHVGGACARARAAPRVLEAASKREREERQLAMGNRLL